MVLKGWYVLSVVFSVLLSTVSGYVLVGGLLSLGFLTCLMAWDLWRRSTLGLVNTPSPHSTYQGGPALVVLLILLGIVGLIYQQTKKKNQLEDADRHLDSDQFRQALDIFTKHKEWRRAAEAVVKSPPGTQIVLLRDLQGHMSKSKLKSLFIKLGDELEANRQYDLAAAAFGLADLPWRAAQTFILGGMVDEALEVLSTSPVLSRDRTRAVRNLAKYAFERNKVMESARLLQSIGLEDEAAAVLVAAGSSPDRLQAGSSVQPHQQVSQSTPTASPRPTPEPQPSTRYQPQPQPRPSTTDEPVDSPSPIGPRSDHRGPSPFVLIRQQLNQAQAMLLEGKVRDAGAVLERSQGLLNRLPGGDEHSEAAELRRGYNRTGEAIRQLNAARTAFRKRRVEEAQVMFSELLDFADDLLSAEVFAEAGLAYEYDPADPEVAREYFEQAATRAKTPEAQSRYKERAESQVKTVSDSLPHAPSDASSTPSSSTPINPNESCCVCKRPVGSGTSVVQCPHCRSAAHYPHLAEWVKIKGTCPVCRQKIQLADINPEEDEQDRLVAA